MHSPIDDNESVRPVLVKAHLGLPQSQLSIRLEHGVVSNIPKDRFWGSLFTDKY